MVAVSTTISRSAASVVNAAGASAGAAGSPPGEVGVAAAGDAWGEVAADVGAPGCCWDWVTGATGGTNSACQPYITTAARKMAMKTLRSMDTLTVGVVLAPQPLRRTRVEPMTTEGMATSETAQAEPGSAEDAMGDNGVAHVVRARRIEPAAACKQG